MALGRYNGSRGRPQYPDSVLSAWKSRWSYDAARSPGMPVEPRARA